MVKPRVAQPRARKVQRQKERAEAKLRKANYFKNRGAKAKGRSQDDAVKHPVRAKPKAEKTDPKNEKSAEIEVSSESENEDEKMINYLEKKLGIKGDKKARAEKTRKLATQDFDDPKLFDIVDSIFQPEINSEEEPGSNANTDDELNSDAVTEDESNSNAGTEDESNSNAGTEDESSSNAGTEDTASGSDAISSDGVQPPASEKYIPPNLRPKTTPSETKRAKTTVGCNLPNLLKELTPKFRSLFNRVSEGNLNVVLDESLKLIYEGKERLELSLLSSSTIKKDVNKFVHEVSEILANEAFAFFELKAASNLVMPQIAVICGLAGVVSSHVLTHYLMRVLRFYDENSTNLFALKSPDNSLLTNRAFDESIDLVERCRQTINGVCIVYFFELADPSVIVEFARRLAAVSDKEHIWHKTRRLDFLAIILRVCGSQLKSDYPAHYTQLMKFINHMTDSLGTASNIHVDFLKQEISSLGKFKKTPMYEKALAMKNWLHGKNGRFRGVDWKSVAYDPADPKIALDKMLKGILESGSRPSVNLKNSTYGGGGDSVSEILKMAKSLRINAPLQQQAFVALVGASDVNNAVERLVGVCTKRNVVNHVVAVILHCALQEKIYNSFYEEVLVCLCSSCDQQVQNRFKRGVRQGLHTLAGALDPAGEHFIRQRATLAKIMFALVNQNLIDASASLTEKFRSRRL